MNAIEILLRDSIDYAGLFPPAELDMPAAVENYARYRRGPTAWALGRFIVPASRLQELRTALPNEAAAPLWRLGVLAGPELTADLDRLFEFQRGQTAAGGLGVAADAIEVKASSVGGVEDIMRKTPPNLQAYIEIPIDRDPKELIGAIGRLGGRAKVRTGGVTSEAFPTTADLLRFIRCCARARVPFKATAGLHHPLRAEYRLTYATGSPSTMMFGFLNVLLASAFLRIGMDDAEAALVLEERSPAAFRVDQAGIAWRDHRLHRSELQSGRQDGMISFGSCSFTEPIGDLEALHLLDTRVHQA